MSTAPPVAGDQVTVTVHVAVQPAIAFEVFTQETDFWWRKGERYRVAGRAPGVLRFEPHVGGRLFESFEGQGQPHTVVMGRITAWEPPSRLVFEWRNPNFAPDERTEVEVKFDATESGTRVTVCHRGWAAFRRDHPVRHGMQGVAFTRSIGAWWSELMTSMRERIAQRDESGKR